jgi:acid phosphatase type 7
MLDRGLEAFIVSLAEPDISIRCIYGSLRKEFAMKRSSLLLISAILLAFTLASSSAVQAPAGNPSAIPDHVTLTWTGNPATTMTVTWRTDPSVTSGFVQYQIGDALTDKALQVQADPRDFTTNLGASRLFTATLVDLSPKTGYSYRVGKESHWSEKLAFSTADSNARTYKFLIFGDSQSRASGDDSYALWRKTIQNAYSANTDAKFFVNVGDLVDLGQSGSHWNEWFAGARGVIDRIPAMPAPGNHESYGSRNTTRPEYWKAQFVLPQNGPEELKGQVYSFDYGSVHFVVLDSQQEEQKQYGDMLKIQAPWLEADLAASKAAWKLVFFHRPPYGNMVGRTNDEIKSAFCPIMEKHHVDLVFNAHDHGIARTYPIKDGVIMDKPSQGVIYYVSGQSGGKTYGNLQKMPYNSFFYNPQDQPNYFVVEVMDRKLAVRTIKQDGEVLDTFTIDKAENH